MSAVSTKLMPASSAAWIMRMLSSWSVLPNDPNIIAPRHRGLTLMPVRPRVRYSMPAEASQGPGGPPRAPASAAESGAGVGCRPQQLPISRALEAAQRRLGELDGVLVARGERPVDQRVGGQRVPLGQLALAIGVVGDVERRNGLPHVAERGVPIFDREPGQDQLARHG